jgi:hypothetical protein
MSLVFVYCYATRIGRRARLDSRGRSAFPVTAPNALIGSSAFIAWTGVADVVSRSPISIGASRASTLQ